MNKKAERRCKIRKKWRWLRRNVLNAQMIWYIGIAECIFWSPAGVSIVLGFLISEWWFSLGAAYIAFWSAPFTPAIPLQLGLAYLIKKIRERRKKKNVIR